MRSAPLLCTVLLGLAGCSFTFDQEAPAFPLVGTPPDMSSFPRLNKGPADDAYVVAGADHAYWVAILEPGDLIRVHRLSKPEAEEELRGSNIYIRYRAFYIFTPHDKAPTDLLIHSAGQSGGAQFQLPAGDGYLLTGGYDTVFLYWIKDPATKTFDIYHRDMSAQRTLPVPDGIDPTQPFSNGGYFDGTGAHLFIRDGNGRLTYYSTTDDTGRGDLDLGVQPRQFIQLDNRSMLTCADESDPPETQGLKVVPISDVKNMQPTLVLDPAPCDPSGIWFLGNDVLYLTGDEMRRVPLDGSGKPRTIFVSSGRQILGITPDGGLVYSTNPPHTYVENATDGWIGDWNFMQRGREAYFSGDNKRLRWLEHAANLNGSGDLTSVLTGPSYGPGGDPVLLARNVFTYGEMSDGRLLAVANYAFFGTQNRIVAIDEQAGISQWVADSASYFFYVPNSTDLLVYVTRSNLTFDLVRVPVPPKMK